jgi:hypothetical protein
MSRFCPLCQPARCLAEHLGLPSLQDRARAKPGARSGQSLGHVPDNSNNNNNNRNNNNNSNNNSSNNNNNTPF